MSIKINQQSPTGIYVGNTPVEKICLGENTIWTKPATGDAEDYASALNLADWDVDMTGNVGEYVKLTEALNAAVAAQVPLRIPAGRLWVNRRIIITIPRGQTATVFSEADTTILVPPVSDGGQSPSIAFRSETVLPKTLLAANIQRGDTTMRLASTDGLLVGDLLHLLAPNTAVERGWNYKKNCVRRVAAISGTTVTVDQPFDFFFTTAEATEVVGYSPAHVNISGLKFVFGKLGNLGLNAVSATVNNIEVEGPLRGWQGDNFSDGLGIVSCDQVLVDNSTFRKLRYCPLIAVGSRNITIRNFRAEQLRHCDANTWAQDILFENGIGYDTDGIIQTHPCIRPTFRNVHDTVMKSGLYGLDLRGMGETVENCSSNSLNVPGPGSNTSAPILNPDYIDMAASMTRTIRNFSSPVAAIKGGKEGTLIIKNCEVPFISASRGHSNGKQRVYVDSLTRETVPHRHRVATNLNNIIPLDGHPVDVPKTSSFSAVRQGVPIVSIVGALPGVVTAPNHGLRENQRITFGHIEGRNSLNNNRFQAVNVTKDTFVIGHKNDGTPLKITGYGDFNNLAPGSYVVSEPNNMEIEQLSLGSKVTVTIANHGLTAGEVIYINGIEGAVELNTYFYKVKEVNANSFVLAEVDTNKNISSTGISAYVSGGRVTPQITIDTIDANSKPNVGFGEKLHITSRIYQETNNYASRPTRLFTKVYDMQGGQSDQRERNGTVRAMVQTPAGTIKVERNFKMRYVHGLTVEDQSTVSSNIDTGSQLGVRIVNVIRHGHPYIGWAGGDWNHPDSNDQFYWTFEVEIDTPEGAAGKISACDIEIEQTRIV